VQKFNFIFLFVQVLPKIIVVPFFPRHGVYCSTDLFHAAVVTDYKCFNSSMMYAIVYNKSMVVFFNFLYFSILAVNILEN